MKEGDKVLCKSILLKECLKHQEKAKRKLEEVMREAQQSANEYGGPKDRYDAFRNQLMSRKDMYARQFQNAQEQYDVLNMIDPENLLDRVEFGAIVETNTQKLFIASGIGKIKAGDCEYFVMSPNVPFYKAIEGKSSGEEFIFRGNTGKILKVF